MAGRSWPSLRLAHNIKADTQCLIVFKTVSAGSPLNVRSCTPYDSRPACTACCACVLRQQVHFVPRPLALSRTFLPLRAHALCMHAGKASQEGWMHRLPLDSHAPHRCSSACPSTRSTSISKRHCFAIILPCLMSRLTRDMLAVGSRACLVVCQPLTRKGPFRRCFLGSPSRSAP